MTEIVEAKAIGYGRSLALGRRMAKALVLWRYELKPEQATGNEGMKPSN